MDRKQETKIVKDALIKAGYTDVKVGHGTGTAYSWLDASMTANKPADCRCSEPGWLCTPCINARLNATKLVLSVTGRHGDYNGNTNVSVRFKEVH